jgi:hypothetical protein
MKNPRLIKCPRCGHIIDKWDRFFDRCTQCRRRLREPKLIPKKVESINTEPCDFFGEYPCQYSSKSMERKRRQGGKDLIKED